MTHKIKDYSNGKIYKIECLNIENSDIYIGSTCKDRLSQRMSGHRSDYNKWKNNNKTSKTSSYDIFDKYGIENCSICLLELVDATTLDEIRAREAYYIKSLKCVNKVVPLRTSKEYNIDNKDKIKEYIKKYYINNKDKIKEYNKEYKIDNKDKFKEYNKEYYIDNKDKFKEYINEYYIDNKDKIKEYRKEYNIDNKDKIKEQRKEYRIDNKDKIKEYKRIKETCPICGSIYNKASKSMHIKTLKHTNAVLL